MLNKNHFTVNMPLNAMPDYLSPEKKIENTALNHYSHYHKVTLFKT